MVLGRYTETGQPTPSGLSSGRLTLLHQRVTGQVPVLNGKAQVLSRRKTTLVIIQRSHRKETGTRWSGNTKDRATTRILVIAMNFTLLLRLVDLLRLAPAAPLYRLVK